MTAPSKTPAQLRNMFGANLRHLAQNYTSISALARDLGINRTQFNRYLSGESFPRPDVLSRICDFFDIDARVLLEPVDSISKEKSQTAHPFLTGFMGQSVQNITEDEFPSGFYKFSRRSFVRNSEFVTGLVYVSHDDKHTFMRGYEPKEAMAIQGIPASAKAREYRGYAMRVEEGIALFVCRRNGLTGSFNYLNQIASFENNFWVGYVARTVRESSSSHRMTRLVYEHLGHNTGRVLSTARSAGFSTFDALEPFHQRLLQTEDPFR